MRRNAERKEEYLAGKADPVKKSDTSLEVETSSNVATSFRCDQREQSFKTGNGLKIHIGKTNKDLILQTDGHTEEITADIAVKTLDVKKYGSKDSETQTRPPVEKVQKEIIQEPFKLDGVGPVDNRPSTD